MPSSDQGISHDRYTIIPRTLIFITRGEQVLLIKGSKTKRLWANKYNGIGGHVERGDDILSAARRELIEETGLCPEKLWLCGTVMVDTGSNPGIGIYLFRGECSEGEVKPSKEGKPTWIPICEVQNYPLVEDLYTLLPKLLQLKRDDQPVSIIYTYDKKDQLVINFRN